MGVAAVAWDRMLFRSLIHGLLALAVLFGPGAEALDCAAGPDQVCTCCCGEAQPQGGCPCATEPGRGTPAPVSQASQEVQAPLPADSIRALRPEPLPLEGMQAALVSGLAEPNSWEGRPARRDGPGLTGPVLSRTCVLRI